MAEKRAGKPKGREESGVLTNKITGMAPIGAPTRQSNITSDSEIMVLKRRLQKLERMNQKLREYMEQNDTIIDSTDTMTVPRFTLCFLR